MVMESTQGTGRRKMPFTQIVARPGKVTSPDFSGFVLRKNN